MQSGTNPLHQIPTDREAVPDGLNRNPKTPGKLHTYLNRFTLAFLIVGQKDAKTHAEFPLSHDKVREGSQSSRPKKELKHQLNPFTMPKGY